MKPLVCFCGYNRVKTSDAWVSVTGVKKGLCVSSAAEKRRILTSRGNAKKTAVRAANKAGRTAVKRETRRIINESL